MKAAGPLIVTALMGARDFAWADGLRRRHYPPRHNRVPAHITLFRHLPPARAAELAHRVNEECRAPPPPAWLTTVLARADGVALAVDSPGLLAIRERLADAFFRDLTPQDQPVPRLHVTVQAKADSRAAQAAQAAICATFVPRPLAIAGLAIWGYRGGPWELVARANFRG